MIDSIKKRRPRDQITIVLWNWDYQLKMKNLNPSIILTIYFNG